MTIKKSLILLFFTKGFFHSPFVSENRNALRHSRRFEKILPLYMLDYKDESEGTDGWVPLVTIADTDQQKMLGFDKYGT